MRVSCGDLREPGGETPPGHSTNGDGVRGTWGAAMATATAEPCFMASAGVRLRSRSRWQ